MEREELIQSARKLYNSPWPNDALKKALEENYPELKESEDERIRKWIIDYISNCTPGIGESMADFTAALAYLEKMKKFSDLKDGMYSCISGELILITEKFPSEDITTEPLPGTITDGNEDEDESIKVYDNMDDLIADALIDEIRKSDMPDSAKHNRIYWVNKHRQKPAEGAALQKAFINSKMDYALEEKRDASDYADVILPTSVAYGENEEEYKLHKIIEAAFIAGQKKEQKPAEWSEEDEKMIERLTRILELGSKGFHADYTKEGYAEAYSWLKSLRPPQYCENCKLKRSVENWKPSEEQMKTLQYLCEQSSHPNPEVMPVLESLYNDLKKLM